MNSNTASTCDSDYIKYYNVCKFKFAFLWLIKLFFESSTLSSLTLMIFITNSLTSNTSPSFKFC